MRNDRFVHDDLLCDKLPAPEDHNDYAQFISAAVPVLPLEKTRPLSARRRTAHNPKLDIIAVQHDAFHLPLADVVIDGHGAIGTEDIQRLPLTEGEVHRSGHGMLG